MAERSVLVCSAGYKSGLPARQGQGWLRKAARLGMRSRPDLWPKWCEAHGLARNLEPTQEYDNTILAIQAALQGLGVLVVPESFVSSMLESRALVTLADESIETGDYSYAIGRRRESARTEAFISWLEECGRRPHPGR